MGDAGAYAFGLLLGWLIILLMAGHPEVSIWSMILLVMWPAVELLLTICRRFKKSESVVKPDRLHFHHLIMRGWMVLSRKKISPLFANSLVVITVSPFIVLTMALAAKFYDNPSGSAIALIVSMLVYFGFFLLVRSLVLKKKYRDRAVLLTAPLWKMLG